MGVIILNGVVYTAAGGSGSGNNTELEARIQALEEKLPFAFGKTEAGDYGYYEDGSEELTPFGSGGSGNGIPLAQPSGVSLTNMDESVVIKWTDPSDTVLEGITLAKWAGTLIVRKEGSAPVSKTDGVAVLDSRVRDQYKTTGYTDRGLTNGTEYYYGIFPYTEQKLYTTDCVVPFTPAAIYPGAPGEISIESSDLRSEMRSTMLGWFPADLKSLIKNVNKKTSAGNKSSTIKTTSENLWIPSEVEVFGSTPNSYSGEGTQYPYYKNADNRRKMDYWWERSPYKSDARAFCFVESDGSAQSTSGILYIPLHVSIGLCI